MRINHLLLSLSLAANLLLGWLLWQSRTLSPKVPEPVLVSAALLDKHSAAIAPWLDSNLPLLASYNPSSSGHTSILDDAGLYPLDSLSPEMRFAAWFISGSNNLRGFSLTPSVRFDFPDSIRYDESHDTEQFNEMPHQHHDFQIPPLMRRHFLKSARDTWKWNFPPPKPDRGPRHAPKPDRGLYVSPDSIGV